MAEEPSDRAFCVVDGSNIATEGRLAPSLAQLDDAVRAFEAEHPELEVIVVVDATFGHRIDLSERAAFDDAVGHGEVVTPPAGAVGRGDAFLLRIAERVGAVVLSNDSFQELHGEHPWLFDPGRLIGGKPVAGVGWIFVERTPIRGPRSRASVAAAKRAGAISASGESGSGDLAPQGSKAKLPDAIDLAAHEALAFGAGSNPGDGSRGSRRSRRRVGPPEAVNGPDEFLNFVIEHPIGSLIEGTVVSFVSHGAMVEAGGIQCYLPLRGLGQPRPKRAREVVGRGEKRPFRLVSLEPARRSAELALADVGFDLESPPLRPLADTTP